MLLHKILFGITPSEMNVPCSPSFAVVLLSNYLNWKINCDDHSSLSEVLKLKQCVKKVSFSPNFSAESLRYQASNCPICRSRKWCSFID